MIKIKGNDYTLLKFLKSSISYVYYEMWLPIYNRPARLLFGNFIGYTDNLIPLMFISVRRLFNQNKCSILSRENANSLINKGFVIVPNSVDKKDNIPMNIAKKWLKLELDNDFILARPNLPTIILYKPQERIPEIKLLITDEVDELLRTYYGSSYYIKSIQLWRNSFVPHVDSEKDIGIANAFHNDGSPRLDLRMFVLLSDGVTRNTGSTRFHDKEDSKKIARKLGYFSRRFFTADVKNMILAKDKLRFFEGDTGDICFINTQECLHASTIPEIGSHRDVVQFEISPSNKHLSKSEVFDLMPDEDPQANPKSVPYRSQRL